MKKILFILAFVNSLDTHSQKIIIHGQEGNRKLMWSDFTGKADKSDPYSAYTHWNISQQASDISLIGDSVVIGSFEVTLELDPVKSWAKKEKFTDDLLVHEQGHFDLGILCQREILSLYKEVKFTKTNISSSIQNIVSRMLWKYDAMMKLYDLETTHSANKEQQAKWNAFFKESLSK